MQLACQALGGKVQSAPAREYGRAPIARSANARRDDLFAGVARRHASLDEPRRPGRRASSDDFVPLAATDTCPHRRGEAPHAADLRPAVPPRSDAHAEGKTILAQLPHQRLRLPRHLEAGRLRRARRSRDDPRAGRRRPRHLRPVRRRRFGGRRGAACIRRSARSSRASSSTTACCARAKRKRSSTSSPSTSRPTCTSSMAEDRFLGALAGVTDPQEKRRRIGHVFIDCFTAEAAKIQGAKFLAQGTLYPDVIESGAARRRPGRHDQAAPQRRRPAGGTRLRADRAAARSVQGRSPPARPGTRPAGGDRLAAPVPRPGPGGALPGRSHQASGSTRCARPTRSSSTKSKRPACTAARRRRSPCCCRCRASA